MKTGDKVIVNFEATKDSKLISNKGIILRIWDEPLTNSEPTRLAEVMLDDATRTRVTVGISEIKIEAPHVKNKFDYAKMRLRSLKSEMGNIQSIFESQDSLHLEFENGMNLELSLREVEYQATEFLSSEIDAIKYS
tara:strand:- start:270 stop:677 length:408 start_codon:yes stop_codon:yes gene_type:complete